jgi:tetratricopeptide (TPR) repeat protein
MGLERIYTFRLAFDEKKLALFPEAVGKDGQAFQAAIGERVRTVFAPLGGLIQGLSVTPRTVKLTWQEDNRQPGVLQKIEAMLAGGKSADGMLLLELFLSDEPENPALLYALGMAYSDQNDMQEAIRLFSRLVEVAPDHINGRVAKGTALLKVGKLSEGISELQAAVQQDPDNLWAHRNLGSGLMLLNRYTEAAANLRLARQVDPEDQQAWFSYAQAFESMDALEQAESAYLKTIEIDEFSAIAEQARKRREQLSERKKI